MSKSKNKKKSYMDIYKSIRKPSLPSPKIMNPKKDYDRRDKSWMNDKDEEDNI